MEEKENAISICVFKKVSKVIVAVFNLVLRARKEVYGEKYFWKQCEK